ncbi:hypothetical protein V6N12_032916 [Hibiscus sabdariffa]|uniref:Secreted protein n=1 Tax=Hibiscus sabdariffa TaxID=183260 RepID=A0ABR2AWN1_9ROSI
MNLSESLHFWLHLHVRLLQEANLHMACRFTWLHTSRSASAGACSFTWFLHFHMHHAAGRGGAGEAGLATWVGLCSLKHG